MTDLLTWKKVLQYHLIPKQRKRKKKEKKLSIMYVRDEVYVKSLTAVVSVVLFAVRQLVRLEHCVSKEFKACTTVLSLLVYLLAYRNSIDPLFGM